MSKNNYKNWPKKDLIKEIELLKKRKKYGLVWEDKKEDVVEQCKKELPVLREIKTRGIITDKNKPANLLIEGDNYHALSVLNYTHEKSIDVIYIDPPYNTGAKDWKYNNHYVDKNDAWRHSKWLSFMEHRLNLAKNLLSPKGVFICAIDHNEQEALGLLLQEIFPGRAIDCITIVHNPRGIQGKNFSYCHEYAYFVYPNDGNQYISTKRRKKPSLRNLRDNGGASTRENGKNCFYPIYVKNGKIVKIGNVPANNFHPVKQSEKLKNNTIKIWPIDARGIERKWRYAGNSLAQITDLIKCNSYKNSFQLRILKTEDRYKTVWIDSKYDSNEYGSKLLGGILEDKFPFPKSLYNVKDCLRAVVQNNLNAVILDYFAGSGTAGHAVLAMNKIDNGKRQFILCTNNENKIATKVCHPRIKKIIKGYTALKGKRVKGLGGNLKYFKTSFVDAKATDANKAKLTKQATEMLCIKEGTFELVLNKKDFKIFKNNNHYTGIIFDQLAIPKFKKEMQNYKGRFSVYIFSLGDDTFDEEFEDVKSKVKLSPIPEAILRVYRRIFKWGLC